MTRGGRRVSAERWAEIALAARHGRTLSAEAWASHLIPVIEEVKAAGATSLRQIATALDARGITTVRGGKWSAVQVQRLLLNVAWYHRRNR